VNINVDTIISHSPVDQCRYALRVNARWYYVL